MDKESRFPFYTIAGENRMQSEYLPEFHKVVETAQVLVCQAEGRYEAQPVQNLLIPHAFSVRAIKREDWKQLIFTEAKAAQ